MNTKSLVVIVGPTASGKSDLAIRLATEYHTEIVSADSRQIYSELEIGTAKPSTDELQQVPHHFINTKSVDQEYDAATFGKEARDVIDRLFLTHDVVILCGGSGLYIKAVLEGFDEVPDIMPGLRKEIIIEYEAKGLEWLKDEVALHDPEYYYVVDRQNPQRLMRALEVIRATGQPFSEFHRKKKVDLPFNVVKIGLEFPRTELYARIDERMDRMVAQGLFEEAETFFARRDLNALQTVGYLEPFGFFQGAYDREEAIRLMKQNSRRYAKRQLTWFKKDSEIKWFHPGDWNEIQNFVHEKTKGVKAP